MRIINLIKKIHTLIHIWYILFEQVCTFLMKFPNYEFQKQCKKFGFESTRLVGLPDWNIH
jgi:hypothetical protein